MTTGSTDHILLLQDDGSRRTADVRTLESLGYQVSVAATFDEALLPEQRADIIVIGVAAGSGRRQAEMGTALFERLDTPVVLLVGEDAAEELGEFDLTLFFDAVPRSANPLFLKRALQMAPQRADFCHEHTQKEEHLQRALEGAGIGAWEWTVATGECYFSREWAEMLGYGPTELEGKLSTWDALVYPDDLAVSSRAMEAHLRGETAYYQNEHRLRCKDGTYKWILDRGKIVERGAAGQPLRVAGTHSDISERKQAEQQLERWEKIFEHAGWGIVISDPAGKNFALMNPAFASMHGYAPAELIGSPILNLFSPECREDAARQIRMANEKNNYSFESVHLRKDGSTFNVQINISVVRDEAGAFQYRIVNVHDITEQQAVVERLRQSEEKYRTLFDTLSEGVALNQVIYDENHEMVDYRVVEVNPNFYQTADYAGPVIGSLATQLYGMTSDYIRTFWHKHKTFNTAQYTEMVSPLTGQVFIVATSPIKNDHFVTSFFNITERKGVEEALRQSETHYRMLIENTLLGYSYCKMLYENDRPADFVYLQVNAAFEKLTGLKEVTGKSVTALIPGIRETSPELFEKYGRVARAGEPEAFEYYLAELQMWFSISVYSSEPGYFIALFDTITEKKKAEIALLESEERYRLLFENMQEGFALQEVITDEQGNTIDFRTLDVNRAYELHTGIKREDVVGRTMLETQPNADRRMIERHGRVAQTGEPFTFEYYLRSFDRHLRVRSFSPKQGQFATIFEDISEMRKAESALRESEQKYRALFDNKVFAILIFDQQTLRILDANEAVVHLYGYGREELLSELTVLDLSAQEDLTLKAIQQTAQTGSSFVPMRYHRRKNNRLFPVEAAIGTFVWQGHPTGFLIIHEISERVNAELKLKESEDRFRQVADTAPVLIWMSGTDAVCNFFSAHWLAYTGRTLAQELGNGWAEGIHPDDFQRCTNTYLDAFIEHREFEMEYRLRRANGEYGILWDRGIPRFTSAGEFLGYIGSCLDVTMRVTAEEKLRASEATLSLAMDVAGAAPWEYDPASDEFIFNDRFYALYATDAEREGGYRIRALAYGERFIHPDDLAMVKARTVLLPSGKRNPNFSAYIEHRAVLPGGVVRWVSAYTHVVFDPSGKLQRMHGVNQDISERKRAEAALQNSNERLIQQLDTIEQLHEELRHQAVHDAVTGLYNRHYLSEVLEPEIIRSEREKSPLSIVMADVDHFKVLNDSYGHPVGDLFLIEIANLLKKQVRGSDFVCRYGGEEFLLVLPGATMQFAMKRAEEIRQKCAEIVIDHAGKPITAKLSLGVATFPDQGRQGSEVIVKADQALYQSKQTGRDRVTGWIDGQLAVYHEEEGD